MSGVKKYDAYRVPCPTCAVYEQRPCLKKNGEIRIAFHSERHHAARRFLATNAEGPVERKRRYKKRYGADWAMLRAKVFAAKGSQCAYCGADAWHIDHRQPKSRGGSDELSNLEPCCERCNLSKGSMTVEEWRGSR